MAAYRALARKYRSRHFGELIGQTALVRTLSNAIEQGRLHHAYLFTGIRGTGKTSTARILAKAINYTGADGTSGPTLGPTDDCAVCRAITEDRHPDVVEIDAASNTGVDDVRTIIDNARYAPVQARYKVFIIDEVHMLSKNAFNALLKTLEEPPPQVVFMLATTEIRKVPVTILSRCQRFDLRRIDIPTLTAHYAEICQKENVAIDDEALRAIARAADGSARDGLSLLDQAIAQSNGEKISLAMVQTMLGQGDRALVAELFDATMQAQLPRVLELLATAYKNGSEPQALLDDFLDFTHLVSRIKVTPALADDPGIGPEWRAAADKAAGAYAASTLSRIWQMALKAVQDVAHAPRAEAALEMAFLRMGYAANLPPLDELLRNPSLAGTTNAVATPAPVAPTPPTTNLRAIAGGAPMMQTQAVAAVQTAPVVETTPGVAAAMNLAELVALCEKNDPMLAATLYTNVRVHKLLANRLDVALLPGVPKDFVTQLQKSLHDWTGARWQIVVVPHSDVQTLSEQDAQIKKAAIMDAYNDPAVQKVRRIIPDITITDLVTE